MDDAATPTGPRTANNMASPCRTVFLDLDEVLCIGQAEACLSLSLAFGRGEIPSSQELASLFSPAARNALAMAHRRSEGAKYVISSTWREHLSREQMVMVLVGGGLQFVAENLHAGNAWRCIPKRVYRERRAEILHWLNTHHQGEPFVVLDDLNSADQLTSVHEHPQCPLFGRVVFCTPGVGLTADHVDAIVSALRRPVATGEPQQP
ncbi:HAD domain-containing protein [Pelomonas sp. Root1444]|uniref:HAD domain-containing protein n=1 Tax=Pelomonas sp. Root1444 TaxID=1736464 RepID=UPI0012F7B6B5|nr:HAD domain-containing protein [Pelomonas sp. Root1444]